MSSVKLAAFLSASALLASPLAYAAPLSWDGGGGNLNWGTAANWSGDTLPGADDDVTINVGGTTTVTQNRSTPTVNSLAGTGNLTFTTVLNRGLNVDEGNYALDGTTTMSRNALSFTGSDQTITTGTIDLDHGSGSLRADGGDLTLAAGARVEGHGSIRGSGTLINQGTIQATGNQLFIRDLTLSNNGLFQVGTGANDGSRARLYNSDFSTGASGQVLIDRGELQLDGDFNLHDALNFESYSRSGGVLKLADGTFDASNSPGGSDARLLGDLVLDNATLQGGSVGALTQQFGTSNVIDNVLIDGSVEVVDGDLEVRGDLTLVTGHRVDVGTFDSLTFNQSQRITSSAEIHLDTGLIAVDQSAELTIEAGAEIHGLGEIGRDGNGRGGSVINEGLIHADGGNRLWIRAGGSEGFDNRGTLRIGTGAGNDNSNLRVGYNNDPWTSANGGSIELQSGALNLEGEFATEQLNPATFQRSGGKINVIGEMDNSGWDLTTTGLGELTVFNGEISGGITGDLEFRGVNQPGRLDGVHVKGHMDMTDEGSYIENGLTLDGSATLLGSALAFDGGDQQLSSSSGATIALTNSVSRLGVSQDGGSVTIGNDVVIEVGNGAEIGTVPNSGLSDTKVVNRGTINLIAGRLNLDPTSFINEGVMNLDEYDVRSLGIADSILLSDHSVLNLAFRAPTSNYGQFHIDSGADVTVGGELNVTFRNFTPLAGTLYEWFVVEDAGSISGLFDTINLPDLSLYDPTLFWSIEYGANDVILRIGDQAGTPVDGGSSLPLLPPFMLILLGAIGFRWR